MYWRLVTFNHRRNESIILLAIQLIHASMSPHHPSNRCYWLQAANRSPYNRSPCSRTEELGSDCGPLQVTWSPRDLISFLSYSQPSTNISCWQRFGFTISKSLIGYEQCGLQPDLTKGHMIREAIDWRATDYVINTLERSRDRLVTSPSI